MTETALVVAGGDPLPEAHRAVLPEADLVIAADGGVDRAIDAGLVVDVAVGDFDSVTAAGYVTIERLNTRIVRYPAHKNETDLELAMLEAARLGAERIVVVGADGGRLDHFLANVLLLADRRLAHLEVDALLGDSEVSVIHRQRSFTGRVGDLLSLLPVGGRADHITTSGLEYPLCDEALEVASPRGISNVMIAPVAVVSVGRGCLLAVRPFHTA